MVGDESGDSAVYSEPRPSTWSTASAETDSNPWTWVTPSYVRRAWGLELSRLKGRRRFGLLWLSADPSSSLDLGGVAPVCAASQEHGDPSSLLASDSELRASRMADCPFVDCWLSGSPMIAVTDGGLDPPPPVWGVFSSPLPSCGIDWIKYTQTAGWAVALGSSSDPILGPTWSAGRRCWTPGIPCSSTVSELMAVYLWLRVVNSWIPDQLVSPSCIGPVHHHSDNDSVVRGLQAWLSGSPHKSPTAQPLWRRIHSVLEDLKSNGVVMSSTWVKGHVDRSEKPEALWTIPERLNLIADATATQHRKDTSGVRFWFPAGWTGAWLWQQDDPSEAAWGNSVQSLVPELAGARNCKAYWLRRRCAITPRGTELMEQPNWDDVVVAAITRKKKGSGGITFRLTSISRDALATDTRRRTAHRLASCALCREWWDPGTI